MDIAALLQQVFAIFQDIFASFSEDDASGVFGKLSELISGFLNSTSTDGE